MSAPVLRFGTSGAGVHVDLDKLIASRLLIQASSGGGKSRAIRQLLEETHGRVQHIVIDPEGEFATLREKFDYILAAKSGGDVLASAKTAKLLCRRLMEIGASAVLDLYELRLDERREFVRIFLDELMMLPKSLWHPLIVIIDEAHIFAPEKGIGEAQSLASVTALTTQGRKRGFCAVLATQRLSKLGKDAAADLRNVMIGATTLDVDVDRAMKDLGFDKSRRNELRALDPGEFFLYGPALTREVTKVKTGDVKTSHPEAGAIGAALPPAPAKVKAMLAKLADLPQEAEQEARSLAELKQENAALRSKVTRIEKGGVTKTVEKPVVDQGAIDRAVATAAREHHRRIDALLKATHGFVTTTRAQMDRLVSALDSSVPVATATVPVHRPETRLVPVAQTAVESVRRFEPSSVAIASNDGVSGPHQRILDAIAWQESLGVMHPSATAVAMLAKYAPNSGGYRNLKSELRVKGWIEYPLAGCIALTDAGRALANAPAGDVTDEEVQRRVYETLSEPQRRVLAPLIAAWPEAMPSGDVAIAANYEAGSGGFRNLKSELRVLGVVDYPRSGMMKASNLLFPVSA